MVDRGVASDWVKYVLAIILFILTAFQLMTPSVESKKYLQWFGAFV